jgi:hypothetical protein
MLLERCEGVRVLGAPFIAARGSDGCGGRWQWPILARGQTSRRWGMTREGRRHPWERAGAVERSGWGGSGASPPDRCRAGLGRDRFVRSSLFRNNHA